ncbi:MAG: hypothetical protein AAFQ64_04845 [Pseudomonadota bacterium]
MKKIGATVFALMLTGAAYAESVPAKLLDQFNDTAVRTERNSVGVASENALRIQREATERANREVLERQNREAYERAQREAAERAQRDAQERIAEQQRQALEQARQRQLQAASAANQNQLNKQLASQDQMGQSGTTIAGGNSSTAFRNSDNAAAQYGGQSDDWVKKSSNSHTAPDGMRFETHWNENLQTGQREQFKTIINP